MTKTEIAKELLKDKDCDNCGWFWRGCYKDGYDKIRKRMVLFLGPTCENWRRRSDQK